MSRAARFTKAEVKRATEGMIAAGVQVRGVEVNDNGFIVLAGEPGAGKRRNRADELYGPQS